MCARRSACASLLPRKRSATGDRKARRRRHDVASRARTAARRRRPSAAALPELHLRGPGGVAASAGAGAPPPPRVPGSRVVGPVRGGRAVGYCLGESDGVALASTRPKVVIDVPDAEPAFRPDLLAVCRWMSEYY